MTEYDAALLKVLETTQFDAASRTKLPRRVLGRGTLALLILLRIYVILAVPIVAYAFIHAIGAR